MLLVSSLGSKIEIQILIKKLHGLGVDKMWVVLVDGIIFFSYTGNKKFEPLLEDSLSFNNDLKI